MPKVVTIGVYGFTLDTFLEALRSADVRLLLDVRQRRAVRGKDYAWANSRRLQDALTQAGVAYDHRTDLVPTTALRELQYADDDLAGVGKRSRVHIGAAYAAGYTEQILDRADLADVVAALPSDGAAAMLCVERDAQACHRILIADRLRERHGVDVAHLTP